MVLTAIRRLAAAAAAGPALVLTGQMWYVRAKFRLPPDACGPLTGEAPAPSNDHEAAAAASTARRRRNIVFIGDSIVTGVGCSAEASPRSTAVRSSAMASGPRERRGGAKEEAEIGPLTGAR